MDEKREQQILEALAEESNIAELLDLTQDAATQLAAKLSEARHGIDDGDIDANGLLRKVARVAVLLDALQIYFGDAVEEEIAFLEQVEEALQ